MQSKEDQCVLELNGEWNQQSFFAFQMLYYPLIGQDASVLYYSLIALSSSPRKIRNHRMILELSSQSIELFMKNREILEQYLLLKSFYDGTKNRFIYQIFMPLEGNSFLRHEVFGRMFLKAKGKQFFEFAKLSFAVVLYDKENCQDISAPFVNVLKGNWQEKEESWYQSVRPSHEVQTTTFPIQFSFDRFLNGFSFIVFPKTARNEDNLLTIGEIATIHGIDELTMRKFVSKSMNVKTKELDVEVLKKKVRESNTDYKKSKGGNPYCEPPVQFFKNKQQGVAVSKGDKLLIESLIVDYKLKTDVVNVLIEYVLTTKQQRFPKAYVEKVAGTWVRLKIDTSQKAIDHVKNEQQKSNTFVKSNKKELPEWFYDQSKVKIDMSDFNEEQLQEDLKKLRGE